MDEKHSQGFGWKLNCSKQKLDELRDALETLKHEIATNSGSIFPTKEGYQVVCSNFVGPLAGFRVEVGRGDFHGEIDLSVGNRSLQSSSLQPPKSFLEVQLSGHAGSLRFARVQARSWELIRYLRILGGIVGGTMLGTLLLAFLQSPPSHEVQTVTFVGGLLLAAMLLITVILTISAGTWVGERMAENLRSRAVMLVTQDRYLNQDLQRWQLLAQKLVELKSSFSPSTQPNAFRRTIAGVAVHRS